MIGKQITELDFSAPLKKVFADSGFLYLSQALEKTPEELMEIPGLTFKHISEYKGFLIENNLRDFQKGFWFIDQD